MPILGRAHIAKKPKLCDANSMTSTQSNKLRSLLLSRRFWVAATVAVIILAGKELGVEIPEDKLTHVIHVALAWIVGDSIQKTV